MAKSALILAASWVYGAPQPAHLGYPPHSHIHAPAEIDETHGPVLLPVFVSSPHGIGTDFAQSGRNGPAVFPSTSLAIRAMGASRRMGSARRRARRRAGQPQPSRAHRDQARR